MSQGSFYKMKGELPDPGRLLSQAQRTAPQSLRLAELPTPVFAFSESFLADHARYLAALAKALDLRILLAQKAFSLYQSYPLLSGALAGTCSSGLFEAQLAREYFPGEIHVYKPAYLPGEMAELLTFVDHLGVNSWAELERLLPLWEKQTRRPEIGIRLNPYYSQVETELYNPAGPHSRLGMPPLDFHAAVARYGGLPEAVTGLQFHALCEENSDALEAVLTHFLAEFGRYLPGLKWLNLGGGHHLCRRDYDVARLARLVEDLHTRYPQLRIYLEPGEGVTLDCGYLVSSVLDLVDNVSHTAILDTSAACHMPDVLEMPYTPRCFLLPADDSPEEQGLCLEGTVYREAEILPSDSFQNASVEAVTKLCQDPCVWRLAGPTCLAGDSIGLYRFPRPLMRGDRVVFCDMALYAHVKTNTFNGMPLPALYCLPTEGKPYVLRQFSYEDFKSRL